MLPQTVDAPASDQAPAPLPDSPLESALGHVEARLDAAMAAMTVTQRHLRQSLEAARQGNLRELPRALAAAVESSGALQDAVGDAAGSWSFDGERHLERGDYVAELLAHAEADGLAGVKDVDGQVYSFPVILKVDARERSLKIGRRAHRGLRPSVVVRFLRRLRERPAKDNTRQLLAAFEKAYLAVTGGTDGVAVPLRRIYDLLVLRPGQGREYTELDFMMDVYRLDRAGRLATPSGRELSLPASTGTHGGKGLRMVTETGEERLYSSIRLDSQ
jgi:hypothetical protein